MFNDTLLRVGLLFYCFCVEKISWIDSMPIRILRRKIASVNMSCDRSDDEITIASEDLALEVVNRYHRRYAFF